MIHTRFRYAVVLSFGAMGCSGFHTADDSFPSVGGDAGYVDGASRATSDGASRLGGDGGGAVDDEPIIVGVIGATGGLERLDAPFRNAAQLAIEQVNAAGGLLGGRQVELKFRNAAAVHDSTPFVELADAGATFVVGQMIEGGIPTSSLPIGYGGAVTVPSTGSDSSYVYLNEALKRQLPYFSLFGGVTLHWQYMQEEEQFGFSSFRGAEPWMLEAAVDVAVEVGCRSVSFVLHNGLGEEVDRAVSAFADEAAGQRSLEVRSGCDGEPHSLLCLSEVASDCVIASTSLASEYLATRPRAYKDAEHILIGHATVSEYAATDFAGDNLVGARLIDSSDLDEGRMQRFDYAYATRFGPDAPTHFYALHYYDYVAAGLLAIEVAGTTDGPAVRDAIRTIGGSDGQVVIGPTELDEGLEALRRGTDVSYRGGSSSCDFSEGVWASSGPPTCFVIESLDPFATNACRF